MPSEDSPAAREPERLKAALADRYQLERKLGAGGMATVYLATDLKHDRLVAVKVLKPEIASIVGTDRLLQEIRITARLTHPHILPLLDSGAADGFLYYVAPYIEGESLRARLDREKQFPLEAALQVTREIAGALDYAHRNGVIHRDIKPENILLSQGKAIVADFGIARALSLSDAPRLTETGLALGTPYYMSPEQASGDRELDGRSDIYSLGCVLYELIVGEPPHTGPTAQAVLARIMVDPVRSIRAVRDAVPESLERTILRALARAPADRFATAEDFAAALARPAEPQLRSGIPRPWRIVAVLGALLLLGVTVARLIPGRSTSNVVPSASHIAVLPFTPSGPDTSLTRLGRDLVFTLSAELDGLGDIRVVDAHTVLAQTARGDAVSPADGAALAQRFGAGSLVRGSLIREGDRVRADFSLLPADGRSEPLARGSVTGAVDSVAALTDSAVHTLLKQVWVGGAAPTPSLEVALKTKSVAALRAFLEGEQLVVDDLWDSAATSYHRAREADPTFWLAGARELYARNWTLRESPDSLIAALRQHRRELPEAERLSTDAIVAWSEDSLALGLLRGQEITQRYPSSWFGWLIYGDMLLHNGPLLGHSYGEAQAAFERALDLNPNLIPVHEHLMMLALQTRDTARAGRAFGELTRLHAGPGLTADGYGSRMLQFRFLLGIARGDSTLTTSLIDSIARDPEPSAGNDGTFYDAFLYGFLDQQIRVCERALQVQGLTRKGWHQRLLALSLAERGAWDSALVVMDKLIASGVDSSASLRAYGIAVIGAWLGALDAGEAGRRRGSAASRLSTPIERAELAWLDGIAAATARDRQALAAARAALGKSEDRAAKVLDRSLAAFDQALTGKTSNAGAALAALEWEEAAAWAPDFVDHPFTIAVDRIAAARWLVDARDFDQAARLLALGDGAYFIHPSVSYSTMVSGLIARERGLIEERLGHAGTARAFYQEFLLRYDRPAVSHRGIVEEAKTKVVALGS
ncbi:MAG TPA: serine/threonine-protein kinase [Gemmatimonadales bacterium]|nr:serine/threonine-protein kinase [Gemmatimonadales bacterium]